MPVPGIDAVPINPRGPAFRVNGAPPMLALKPLRERFNRTPGMTLKDLRKRQPMTALPVKAVWYPDLCGIATPLRWIAERFKNLRSERNAKEVEIFSRAATG